MKVSLILCSKNGGERLLECLCRIERLSAPNDFELFLVDNGSTDGVSFERMVEFARKSRLECQTLQTFVAGNSAGRNLALTKASGELLVFLDDDCYADSNLVVDWVTIFSRLDIGFASGMIVRFNSGQSMLGCNENPNEEFVRAGSFVRRGLIQGSNMAFRRKCLAMVGPFDERFGAGTPFAGEEWDLALRASLAGWSGGYFPQPVVIHDHRRFDAEARARLLQYDYGAGAVYAKNTFGPKGLLIARKFIGDLIRNGSDRSRMKMLLKGYADYCLKGLRVSSR